MRVDAITNTNFRARVNIRVSENTGRKYLYNEIENLRKEFKFPANFRTQEIELPSISEKVMAKLKELGINFIIP